MATTWPKTLKFCCSVPELRISKTHSGNLTQGQTGATYSITVSNAGEDATSGEVRVQDRLPTGLSPTSASGSGWTCMISGSMVLAGQGGKTFAAVALVQTQGLVTMVPVIPSKAPQVP